MGRRINSNQVIDVLAEAMIEHRIPDYIRSDNGPEFVAKQLRRWLAKTGARTLYIEPGSPWENGYCESFNSKMRDEFLNGEIFYSMKEVRVLTERWRVYYNTERPHSSLGYRPPAPAAWQTEASQRHGKVESKQRFHFPTPPTTATASYLPLPLSYTNRLTGTNYRAGHYDAAGDTLYDGKNRYWFDAEGELCAVQNQVSMSTTQYIYDAGGARIGKGTLASPPSSYTATCAPPLGSGFTLKARYLVNLDGEQVSELSETGSEAWAHSNIWTAGRLLATYDPHGIHFHLTDPLGTRRIQANASGQVEETCTSLPFGNDLNNPPSATCYGSDDATENHYTGKERDTESGLPGNLYQ